MSTGVGSACCGGRRMTSSSCSPSSGPGPHREAGRPRRGGGTRARGREAGRLARGAARRLLRRLPPRRVRQDKVAGKTLLWQDGLVTLRLEATSRRRKRSASHARLTGLRRDAQGSCSPSCLCSLPPVASAGTVETRRRSRCRTARRSSSSKEDVGSGFTLFDRGEQRESTSARRGTTRTASGGKAGGRPASAGRDAGDGRCPRGRVPRRPVRLGR